MTDYFLIHGPETFMLVFSVLLLAGILAGKIGSKYGIPALLLFLLTGMIFGSDGLGLQFENMHLTKGIGMFALSIILFTGGMDTHMKEIKVAGKASLVLSTLGVLLTTLLTGSFIYLLSYYHWIPKEITLPLGLLLAAAMSSTDSASVFAILRSQQMQLKENLKPTLELESGSNDPMAYMLMVVLMEAMTSGNTSLFSIFSTLAAQFILGSLLGLLLGGLTISILNKINIPNNMLYPIIVLSSVFATFSITTLVGGNGYLAVYLAGIVLGNSKVIHRKSIQTFYSGLTWLVQTILFILLGLLVNPHELLGILGVALLIAFFLIFIGRPISVFLCLIPFRSYSYKGKLFLSWVGLRGAVPIIFAVTLIVSGITEAQYMFNIIFVITIVSLILQGSTISLVAKKLNLAIPAKAKGNLFGIEIPEETGTFMEERVVTPEMLEDGDLLMDMDLKDEELVIMVKRGDNYRIPNGKMKILPKDVLLIVSEKNEAQQTFDSKLEQKKQLKRLRKKLFRHILRNG